MVTTSIVTTIVAYSQLEFNFSLSVLREQWYLALTKSLIHRDSWGLTRVIKLACDTMKVEEKRTILFEIYSKFQIR